MKVIVCLDDRGGMTFNSRRQSRDPAVINDIISTIGHKRLFISPFSEKLFEGSKGVKVAKDPLSRAGANDFCFIEDLPLLDYADKINTIIIYKWNRHYPSDKKFDIPLCDRGFNLVETEDFVGASHQKITKEIYRR